jgi:hypothetical protein
MLPRYVNLTFVHHVTVRFFERFLFACPHLYDSPLQSIELKREEFHRYLEKAGVIDDLTKVLVGLYELPEKPVNANDFVKEYLGAPIDEDAEKLKKLCAEQTRIIKEQEDTIASLRAEVAELKEKQQ